MAKPLTKKTKRQLEAINQLKRMESDLKTLRTLLPQPEDYATKAEYRRAVNTANKNFWKMPRLGKKVEGVGLGEYTIRLEKQIADLKNLMGKPIIGPGVQIPAYLKGLTEDEKIATNTLHIGFGNAQQRRRNPLLKIRKGIGKSETWDNPFYNRRYDKAVIKEEKIVAEAAQRDYKRSTDNWESDPDGWMKELPIWHSLNPLSPNRVAPSGEEVGAPASISQQNKLNNYKGTQPFNIDAGATPWHDRRIRGPKQADAETRALLIRNTGNERAVNRLSSDQLSRYRISGGFESDKGIQLVGGGSRSEFIKKLTISD